MTSPSEFDTAFNDLTAAAAIQRAVLNVRDSDNKQRGSGYTLLYKHLNVAFFAKKCNAAVEFRSRPEVATRAWRNQSGSNTTNNVNLIERW